jgi:hypothetical protein
MQSSTRHGGEAEATCIPVVFLCSSQTSCTCMLHTRCLEQCTRRSRSMRPYPDIHVALVHPCCSTYTNAVSACRGRTGRIGRCLASHNIIAGWHYFAHLIAKRLRHSYTQVYRVIDIDSRYAWDQANLDLASDSAIMKPCAYYAML